MTTNKHVCRMTSSSNLIIESYYFIALSLSGRIQRCI